jgi:hypothetical protein
MAILKRVPIQFRRQRIFTCHYYCPDCDAEWSDEMLCVGDSWCPTCDRKCAPEAHDEHEEIRPQFAGLPEITDEEAA